jgi:hypothetical protein
VLRGSTLAREGKGEEGVVERWRLWTEKGRRRAEVRVEVGAVSSTPRSSFERHV